MKDNSFFNSTATADVLHLSPGPNQTVIQNYFKISYNLVRVFHKLSDYVSGTKAESTLCGLVSLCREGMRETGGGDRTVAECCQDDRCGCLKWTLKAEGRLAVSRCLNKNEATMGGRFVKSISKSRITGKG